MLKPILVTGGLVAGLLATTLPRTPQVAPGLAPLTSRQLTTETTAELEVAAGRDAPILLAAAVDRKERKEVAPTQKVVAKSEKALPVEPVFERAAERVVADTVAASTELLMAVAVIKAAPAAVEPSRVVAARPKKAEATAQAPLLLAAASGQVAEVTRLLGVGAALNCRDAAGNTPLILAVSGGHKELVAYLLTRPNIDLMATNKAGQSALYLAIKQNSHQLVTVLTEQLPAAADPQIVLVAGRFGDSKMWQLLTARGFLLPASEPQVLVAAQQQKNVGLSEFLLARPGTAVAANTADASDELDGQLLAMAPKPAARLKQEYDLAKRAAPRSEVKALGFVVANAPMVAESEQMQVMGFGGAGASGRGAMVRGRSKAKLRRMVMPVDTFPVTIASRDNFESKDSNPLKEVAKTPVSTFSIDVDTAAYAFMRRQLNRGRLPNKDAVRIEEYINYFNYHYQPPVAGEHPFAPTLAVYPTPWNSETLLLHVGIKGYSLKQAQKPKSNLVLLLDVSGSMRAPDKLPLVKSSLLLLLDRLQPEDKVSIVVYAGAAGTVLEPTSVANKERIKQALGRLSAGGSTAGGAGIRLAYALARQNFDPEAVNRVMICTDGDFNVGITDIEELKSYIVTERKSGIYLSILGFGQGNLNDHLMQKLAQNGNGNAYHIDTLSEARKVLVDEAEQTLFTIAKDVKLQVEFNPSMVAEYRLIGYETRMLKREDFRNDQVDAGEIGAGHSVTAIYEITPVGSAARRLPPLRYSKGEQVEAADSSTEYAFLKIRYKRPDSDTSTLMTTPITQAFRFEKGAKLPDDIRFAAAVAAFGQILKDPTYLERFSYQDIIALAVGARGPDNFGYRSEFINLVRLAAAID